MKHRVFQNIQLFCGGIKNTGKIVYPICNIVFISVLILYSDNCHCKNYELKCVRYEGLIYEAKRIKKIVFIFYLTLDLQFHINVVQGF